MSLGEFLRYRWQAGRRAWRGAPADEWAVQADQQGVLLRHESYRGFLAKSVSEEHATWSEIVRVVAWKQDNFTWDTIWLRFELVGERALDVPEDAVGWRSLADGLSRLLPGSAALEEWWPAVAFPAFAENVVQLYPPPNNSSKPTPLRGAA
ncbi:hypothetical protein [Lysobacter sp. TY2-98]|uniref:hypothetical protein n=1 Tax=Lysobacter sp. TY2-98 TaxID=2290922 RepID=UPI0013B3E122|nr:hypothetical protein [Lysobacter sp. TY2-98]